MTTISGKIVVITGGTSGIGRHLALKLADRGADVAIIARNRSRLLKTARNIETRTNRKVLPFTCDLTDRGEISSITARIKQELGAADILVNNAGIVSGSPFLDLTEEQIEATFQTNILAPFRMTKAFLPEMLDRNSGHIVTVASAAGLVGVNRQTDYAASKHAAIGFMESLRAELRHSGSSVKTTTIMPYYTDTGMFRGVKTNRLLGLPLLKEEYVAEKIVEAIEKNHAEIKLPKLLYALPLMRAVLPVRAFDQMIDLFRVNDSMERVVTREKES